MLFEVHINPWTYEHETNDYDEAYTYADFLAENYPHNDTYIYHYGNEDEFGYVELLKKELVFKGSPEEEEEE